MFKPKTIQTKLFFSYSILIVGIIAAFVISYYIYSAKVLENKSSESLHQLSDSITTQLDSTLKNMDNVSEKFLFSSMFSSITKIYPGLKDLFYSYSQNPDMNLINSQRQFNDILYMILGPQFSVPQINIFNMSGFYIGAGNHTVFGTAPDKKIDEKDWVKETLKIDGNKYITTPHADDWGYTDTPVISLCRAFAPDWGSNVSNIIEVQQNYDVISSIIKKAISSPSDSSASDRAVYIFNQAGQIIYPYPADTSESKIAGTYWEMLKSRKITYNTEIFKNTSDNSTDIISYTHSDFSNWTTLVIEPEKALLHPLIVFRNNTLALGLIIVLITLAVSYFVSKGLSTPIKRIHKSIKGLSLETLTPGIPHYVDSGLNELEELNLSYIEMCERLKASLEEVVSSRSHEIQAQMLALQSQMNPHFLYNTLTTISIMAEDAGNTHIVKICENLSNMLRYISSDNTAPVTINQELDHTLSFLNLMKIRYGNHIIIDMQIPESIVEVLVPKLIIEPLVENCTKYGINVEPPWKISIDGCQQDDRWVVSVRDNGPGFDEMKIKSIMDRLITLERQKALPKLELNGMGLVNIYMRLKLLYGDEAVFELHNHPDGGAVVTIGGPIKDS